MVWGEFYWYVNDIKECNHNDNGDNGWLGLWYINPFWDTGC